MAMENSDQLTGNHEMPSERAPTPSCIQPAASLLDEHDHMCLQREEENETGLPSPAPIPPIPDGSMQSSTTDTVEHLIDAVDQNDIPRLRRFLEANPHIDINDATITTSLGVETALHRCCRTGNLQMVEALLATPGINVNNKAAKFIGTPLHVAVQCRQVPVIKLLLERPELDINATCEHAGGCTPWHLAMPDVEVAKLLLAKGVQVTVQDHTGNTAFHNAEKSFQAVQFLLEQTELDPGIPNKNGDTVLRWAAGRGNIEVLRVLLAAGRPDPNVKSGDGRTPLHYASELTSDDPGWVETLLRVKDVDVDAQADDGFTALHFAAARGNMKIVATLLEHGANTNILTNSPFVTNAEGVADMAGHIEITDLIRHYRRRTIDPKFSRCCEQDDLNKACVVWRWPRLSSSAAARSRRQDGKSGVSAMSAYDMIYNVSTSYLRRAREETAGPVPPPTATWQSRVIPWLEREGRAQPTRAEFKPSLENKYVRWIHLPANSVSPAPLTFLCMQSNGVDIIVPQRNWVEVSA